MAESSNWTLWRQDDNGSSSVISRHLAKDEAKSRMAELEARGHKQHYWVEEEIGPKQPRLNLIVIRAADLETSKAFYELIGLQFETHRHGTGEEHFACESPSFVFEIYPANDRPSIGARVGFAVDSVDELVERIRNQGFKVLSPPRDSPWGRRSVVQDPDGHSVELIRPAS